MILFRAIAFGKNTEISNGKIELTFEFDFIQLRFYAFLRVAYLAAFKHFGYSYFFSEGELAR